MRQVICISSCLNRSHTCFSARKTRLILRNLATSIKIHSWRRGAKSFLPIHFSLFHFNFLNIFFELALKSLISKYCRARWICFQCVNLVKLSSTKLIKWGGNYSIMQRKWCYSITIGACLHSNVKDWIAK